MRILAANANYPDHYHGWAPWNRAANLALAAEGVELEVIAPRPFALNIPGMPYRTVAKLPLSKRDEEGDVHYPRFMYAIPKALFYGLSGESYRRRVTNYVRANIRPTDAIHAHHVYPDGYGMLDLAREWRVPLIVDIHGDDVFLKHIHNKVAGKKWLQGMYHADAIICVSERLRQLAIQHGLSEARLHYIPLGVDTGRYCPRPREAAKAEVGIESSFLFLSVGQLIPRKGVDIAIRAFAQVKDDVRQQATFAIIGEGPERAGLERLCQNLGVQEDVQFIGRVPSELLPTWYAAADSFVLSSLSEGRPTVVNEAMASGCAVIAADVGGVSEQVAHGQTGFVVPPSNSMRIAEQMTKMLSAPGLSEEFGRAGRQRVLDEGWTWESYAARVVGLYRSTGAGN